MIYNESFENEYKRPIESEREAIKLGVYNGEDLAVFKQDLAQLRHMNFGGSLEAHLESIEDYFAPNHFGFLYIQKDKLLCALIGRYTTDWLPPNICKYMREYSDETPDRPVLWCASLTTHPDFQAKGLASRCLLNFSHYAEHHYRYTGAFIGCRIRQHNFASERSFAKAGFMPTHLFDEEDFTNLTNFQFWIKIIPPLYSTEAETFMSAEKRQELHSSANTYYRPKGQLGHSK